MGSFFKKILRIFNLTHDLDKFRCVEIFEIFSSHLNVYGYINYHIEKVEFELI